MTHPKFRNGQFSGLESSNEILQGCEDVAGCNFDLDDPENCRAHRIWQDPTAAEIAAVERAAWSYAPSDADELHWGCETIRRSA